MKIDGSILKKRYDPAAEFDIADEFVDAAIAVAYADERSSARAEGMANPVQGRD